MTEEEEKILSEKESLALIATMINKAKDSYNDTGIGAIMWGSVIAICSLVRFTELQFNYRLPFDIFLLSIAAVIPQILIARKEKRQRTVRSYDDAFMLYLWLGFGIAITLLSITINVVFIEWSPVFNEYKTLTGHPPAYRFSEYVSSFFLILYGLPTFITGATLKFKPLLWGGIICWISCIVCLFTIIKIDCLLTALSAICAWLIPGILMMREYRKAKQGLKKMDV